MLKSLTIQNYALISHLNIDFNKGFSVITGETGAGKSIIIGALSLILGQRADIKSIKQGTDKCFIEGIFDISSYKMDEFFDEKELEYDANNCILRREIYSSGKSRAFINDSPVTLNDLKELASRLIDIHSQHQNLLLGDTEFQLQVIDILARNKKLKEEYRQVYSEYLFLSHQLSELKEKAQKHSVEQDYLQFQFHQLNEAHLQPEEQSKLEEDAEVLSHIEEIKTGLYSIGQYFSDEEKGIIFSLKSCMNIAQSLEKIFPSSSEIAERLQSTYIDLKDLSFEINKKYDNLELDPERLQWINDRLNLIYSLQQKHNLSSVEELITLREDLNQQLNAIENYEEEIKNSEKKLLLQRKEIFSKAQELSETRKKAIIPFEKELINTVRVLGMPALKFTCELKEKEFPDSNGLDKINFLFSANQSEELKPISQTASGGEISRLMLGIKALIAGATTLPTIIFDEIDTGVSGEIADKMGVIMQQMGKVMQVISITHLPQIAAKGDSHLFVYKEDKENNTETGIRLLSEETRVKEIACMLSGSKLTDAAIENAKELLKQKN